MRRNNRTDTQRDSRRDTQQTNPFDGRTAGENRHGGRRAAIHAFPGASTASCRYPTRAAKTTEAGGVSHPPPRPLTKATQPPSLRPGALFKLTVLAAPAVEPERRRAAIPRRLALDACPNAGQNTTPSLRDLVAAFHAMDFALARRHARTRSEDPVYDGVVDLILHRPVRGPSTGHRRFPVTLANPGNHMGVGVAGSKDGGARGAGADRGAMFDIQAVRVGRWQRATRCQPDGYGPARTGVSQGDQGGTIMGRLDGKVAAVTGGASGIGEATVRRFVAEGASVAFCDRDGERGQRVAAELVAAGAKVAFTQADVGTEAACIDFVNGAARHFGRLDILINNAGIRAYEKVDEASAASWNEMLNVNLMSYVFCAKAAVPLMRRGGGGTIVNTASVRSVVAGGGNLQYDTTKAAIAGLTRGLAADHSAEGIRVNAVGPGPIYTPFHARRIADSGETVEQYNAKAAQGTMMKRPGRAEEVAAAILFLASDDASYVTGALLFVDGGMTAM